LESYHEQARELEEALGKVKGIQEQIASVTQQRENVLQQRQRLRDSWENEDALIELSKLSARVEMHDARLASLATQLLGAEASLKATLDTFGFSCHSLFMMLRGHLVKVASARIAATLHPRFRVSSGGRISEIAVMDTAVVDFEPLRIPMLGAFMTIPNPADVVRLATESLAKADALLTEAAKHADFTPPAAKPLTVAA
jgi:hypothetical protein